MLGQAKISGFIEVPIATLVRFVNVNKTVCILIRQTVKHKTVKIV